MNMDHHFLNNRQHTNNFMEPHRGTMILVFGIIGLVFCALFSILAWVLGNQDLRKIDKGFMDPQGRETTNIGMILGIIGVCIWALGVFAWVIMMFFNILLPL